MRLNILKQYNKCLDGGIKLKAKLSDTLIEDDTMFVDFSFKHMFGCYFIVVETGAIWRMVKEGEDYYLEDTNKIIKNFNEWDYFIRNNRMYFTYNSYSIFYIDLTSNIHNEYSLFCFIVYKLHENKDIIKKILQNFNREFSKRLIDLGILD